MLFSEIPLLARPAAARACGFTAVEFWWPFDTPVPSDRDVEAFVAAIRDSGTELTALNLYGGERAAGERGIVCLPKRQLEFVDNVAITADIGRRLGCRVFNALYGNIGPDDDRGVAHATAIENLARCAETVAPFGGTVVIEAISDPAPYPLRTSVDVLAVLADVHHGTEVRNVKMLADVYHLATNGDDVEQLLRDNLDLIGHVQLADAPGRHEPGSGTLPIRRYLDLLAHGGYTGTMGLEYVPRRGTSQAFDWLADYPVLIS